MEIKAELNKPYTETQRADFIVENNHRLGYIIKETNTALEAWGMTEEEELQQAKENKYNEALTGAKSFIDNDACFQFDENNSIEATDGNIGKMTAYAVGFQSGIIETVTWTSKEDNVLILNADDVSRILTGLGGIQSDVWNRQFVNYKTRINNAKTIQAVEAIKIIYVN